MKKIALYIELAIFSLFMTGCGEFLEPSSSDEYVPENASALDEMLVGSAYPGGADENGRLFMFHHALDDDIMVTRENVGPNLNTTLDEEKYFAIFTLQPDMFLKMKEGGWYYFIWDDYYKKILGTNAALDYIDGVSDALETKEYVKAQALGLRAFYYFNLVNLFGVPYTHDSGAPGVPLKLTSNLSTALTGRNSVKEVYEQVLSDLNGAAILFARLPARKQFSKDYRMNLPTVQLLKARTYLFMGEWESAIRLADSVLMYPQFQLYDLNQFAVSVSMPKPHYSNYDNGESMWHYGNMSDLFSVANRIGYPEGGSDTRYFFNASDELLNSFTDEGDLRKDLYVFDEYKNDYMHTKLPNKRAMGKVLCNEYQVPQSGNGFALSVRLSEAYLILSEAHAMLGHSADALRYLNALRSKRISDYQDVIGLDGEELIRFVREERRRELCFEGMRWFDLRRWGMESFTKMWKVYDEEPVRYVIEKNDPAFTLPIPQDIIDRNPGLEQNALAPFRIGI